MHSDHSEDQMNSEDAALCAAINSLGYSISSVYDLFNQSELGFRKDYSSAYPLLIEHLHVQHHPRIREGVIRALTVRNGGKAIWEPLLAEFMKEDDKILRWTLANALKTAMPSRQRVKHPAIADVFSSYGAR